MYGGREHRRPGKQLGIDMRLAILSDLHVLGPGEHEQTNEYLRTLGDDDSRVKRRVRRGLNRVRNRFWHSHPEARAACFVQALEQVSAFNPEWVVVNGDYAGDHLGVGLSDDHTFESAHHVVDLIREVFPARSIFNFGDHDIGKYNTVRRCGGIRLKSLERGNQLGLQSFWKREYHGHMLIGVNSSLITLDLFLPEALTEEVDTWRELQREHLKLIRETFAALPADEKVVVFCHDPAAITRLDEIPEVRAVKDQIQCTVIGHLHSPFLLRWTQWMRHLPVLHGAYPIARIVSHGAQGAKTWSGYRPVVCPSTYGVGNHVSGGVLFIEENPVGDIHITQKRITI